ncbi:hypothetical protein BV25DRAFT_1826340 [Artomyces pyxidatus]|uniref:Uncharacterized protein n=1 Tax=Artomyces pyxidatus TaxID=48021 RepID=A0ACB8T0F4_9AGAM|nr:hypothetical protein BV25DRAFT_1826340 [Artomyces pyxidatus]
MFICRFRLLRAQVPALHASNTRRLLSTTLYRRSVDTKSYVIGEHSPHETLLEHSVDESSPVASQDLHGQLRLSPKPHAEHTDLDDGEIDDGAKSGEAEEAKARGASQPKRRLPPALYDVYKILRERHYDLPIQRLSVEDVNDISAVARSKGHATVLDNLARNVLDFVEKPLRSELAGALLTNDNFYLQQVTTSIALLFNVSPNPERYLLAARAVHTVLDDPFGSRNQPVLYSLTTLLLRLSDDHKNTSRHLQLPHPLVWSAFRLIMCLSRDSATMPSALSLFQRFIDTQHIPPEAIQNVDLSSKNFPLIVATSLVRSCLFWNWRGRATSMLSTYLQDPSTPAAPIAQLCFDVLYSVLDFPTSKELYLTLSLIKALAKRHDPVFVPHGIVREIYDEALRVGTPGIVGALYAFSRRPSVLQLHEYPTPGGAALPWLLRHFAFRAKDTRMARELVRHVTKKNVPIPPQHRAEFIMLVAEQGFAVLARTLWERYSVGRHKRLIVANGSVVVRMCSLFANLIRRTKHRMTVLQDAAKPDDVHAIEGDDDLDSEEPRSPDPELELVQKTLEDYTTFSSHVLDQYRRAKEPLRKATQEDLNALARANFILGNITQGFAALRVTVDRLEVPDIHDVNVALSAVALHNPRAALEMIERMVHKGPSPDSVSFGTVIHYAALHRDMETLHDLCELARKVDRPFTLKTVVSIIRTSLTLSGDDMDAVRDNLTRALAIIEVNQHAAYLATPRMGVYCIAHALRADEPALAVKFWRLLIQGRTSVQEERTLRRAIARRTEALEAKALACDSSGVVERAGIR